MIWTFGANVLCLALYVKNHIFVFIGDTLSDQVRVLNLSQNGL